MILGYDLHAILVFADENKNFAYTVPGLEHVPPSPPKAHTLCASQLLATPEKKYAGYRQTSALHMLQGRDHGLQNAASTLGWMDNAPVAGSR